MFELFLRIQHDCPNNNSSGKYPGARISVWSNGGRDILEVEADGFEAFQGLQNELSGKSKSSRAQIISKTYCRDKFQLVARTCTYSAGKNTALTGPIIERHNFM